MHRYFASSRYLILIAVAGSFVAATTLLIYGGAEIVHAVGRLLAERTVSRRVGAALALSFIEAVDLFLLATVLYIMALGLYELFVVDDDRRRVQVPAWLEIHDLDDLKDKLAAVVVVVMGVSFLGEVVTWDGERNLLYFGAGIALVIAALTYFLSHRMRK